MNCTKASAPGSSLGRAEDWVTWGTRGPGLDVPHMPRAVIRQTLLEEESWGRLVPGRFEEAITVRAISSGFRPPREPVGSGQRVSSPAQAEMRFL